MYRFTLTHAIPAARVAKRSRVEVIEEEARATLEEILGRYPLDDRDDYLEDILEDAAGGYPFRIRVKVPGGGPAHLEGGRVAA